MTIADQLTLLNSTKTGIKTALEAKGVAVGTDPFSTYPAKIGAISTSGWKRPTDWLVVPSVSDTERKFVGLLAVYDDDVNWVSFYTLGCTIDWGDGVVEVQADGANRADHKYTYANLPASSLCSRGYRQVLITITPTAGKTGNFTNLQLNVDAPIITGGSNMHHRWLDVECAGTTISTLTFGYQGMLERVKLGVNNVANGNGMFQTCGMLQEARLNLAKVTSANSMFSQCTSLESVELDLPAAISATNLFSGCSSLKKAKLTNTAKIKTWNQAFYGCFRLEEVSDLNMAAATDVTSLFSSCRVLLKIPALTGLSNTAIIGGLVSSGNDLIREIPAMDLSVYGYAYYNGMYSLVRSQVTGTFRNSSYKTCNLSAAAINEIFTNLVSGTSRTIDVSTNPGSSTCTPSIATAKGWTVTV